MLHLHFLLCVYSSVFTSVCLWLCTCVNVTVQACATMHARVQVSFPVCLNTSSYQHVVVVRKCYRTVVACYDFIIMFVGCLKERVSHLAGNIVKGISLLTTILGGNMRKKKFTHCNQNILPSTCPSSAAANRQWQEGSFVMLMKHLLSG